MLLRNKQLITLRFCIILISLSFLPSLGFSRVLNIYEAKTSVIQYHKSGKYLKDVASQAHAAKKFILKRIKKKDAHEKLTVVFDIDDTLLTQYSYALETDFSQLVPPLVKYMDQADMPAIEPMLDLFNFAKEKGVFVILITGRHPDMKDITVKNLKKAGFDGWTALYMDTPDQKHPTAQEFKTAMRAEITQEGYTIIVNIGDQYSDIKGGYSEKTYKLPNHIYYVK